ncbi:hypothetical protein AB0H07_43580 [Streptomyces sp. NPDC021354]|uniref:hypothetical protein n=1 Tax=Streptomyces sp. NPDC021354 TaxID=3154793 RepID=UPI0033FEAC39
MAYKDDLDRLDKLRAIAKGHTLRLEDVRPWPFPEFERLITACLNADPGARPKAVELAGAC